MKVYEETCGCGARIELSDYLLENTRREYIEGFRAQHTGHDSGASLKALESRYSALEKAAKEAFNTWDTRWRGKWTVQEDFPAQMNALGAILDAPKEGE